MCVCVFVCLSLCASYIPLSVLANGVLGLGCDLVLSDLGLGSPEFAENTCLANFPFETVGLVEVLGFH